MAVKAIAVIFCSFLAIWVGIVDSATPHQAPAPAVDCSTLFMNLVDCLDFVTNGSTVSKPQGSCCSGLKTVLKTDAHCLCEGFKSSAQLGVSLNITKALTLPAVCHLSSPPLSECGLDTGSPAISPSVALPPSIAAGGPAPDTGITGVAPALAPGSSKNASSSSTTISTGSLVVAVFVALFSLLRDNCALY